MIELFLILRYFYIYKNYIVYIYENIISLV